MSDDRDDRKTPPTGGVKMQWWQQPQEQVTPVYQSKFSEPARAAEVVTSASVVAPAASSTNVLVPDIGEELEAEARRRMRAEANGERVTIHANPALSVAKLRRRMSRTALFFFPAILAMLALPLLMVPDGRGFGMLLGVMLGAVSAFTLEFALIYAVMSRIYKRQREPVARLTDEGIEIHTYGYDVGMIRWNEIAEIRSYRSIYKFVGISLRDVDAFCATRPRKATSLIRMNKSTIRFGAAKRKPVFHINISEENMPIAADALVAKIDAFRATRGV